jgi:FKBP-type peptidyl-prolyl cis-trans isomerase FkpA
MKLSHLLLPLLTVFGFASCEKEADYDRLITDYLAEKNITNAVRAPSGLYYVVETPGNGTFPAATSTVLINYVGRLLDDTVFDQNNNISFNLGGVIPGFREGCQYFSPGSSGLLIMPPSLGYGSQAVGSIPANSVLVFEVDMIDIL